MILSPDNNDAAVVGAKIEAPKEFVKACEKSPSSTVIKRQTAYTTIHRAWKLQTFTALAQTRPKEVERSGVVSAVAKVEPDGALKTSENVDPVGSLTQKSLQTEPPNVLWLTWLGQMLSGGPFQAPLPVENNSWSSFWTCRRGPL